MKFSEQTLKVLKNYATINQGIVIKKGNVISTISPQKNILSESEITDSIPQDFAVYDLNNFLSVLSLNKDPEIEFDDKNAIIKSLNGRSKMKYRFTEPTLILSPPDKKLTLPSVDVEFTLTEEDYAWILRTAPVLGSPHVAVVGDGEKVSLLVFDGANDAAHTNSIELDVTTSSTFKLIFKFDNLKMISGTYDVQVSSKGIAHFKNTKEKIQYWIAIESASTFKD
jgi:hypothetical protein